MNQDLLIRTFSIVLLTSSLAHAQEDTASTLSDDVATLDVTYLKEDSSARSVIIREEVAQQLVVPSIATRTVLTEDEKETALLPSVDTIAGSEIRTHQRYDLASVLRQSAGVSVASTGGEGTQTSIFVRGMESDHTVVLLNGRRLPRGLAGLYHVEFLDVSNLESVQFSRGAASSLYGSDAIAGAIDLRSTDARFVESNTLSTYAEGGSFNTFRSGTKVTLRDGAVGIALDGSFLDTKNDRIQSDYDNATFRGNVAVELGDGIYFDILGSVQNAFLEVPGSRFAFDGTPNPGFPEQQTNENQSGLFSPRISVIRDDWDFTTFYSYTTNELTALQTPFFNDNFLEQDGSEFEAVFNYHPSDDLTLSLGGGSYEYRFDRTPLPAGPFNLPSNFEYGFSSVFAQADLALPANFHLLTSGRYDDHDTYESKGTYTAQLSHKIEPTGTTVFGKVATGYKAPTGQDLLFTSSLTSASDLMPEESLTYEFGIQQEVFSGEGLVSLTYFNNEIENLVDNDPITFGAAQVDTESDGFEFEFQIAATDRLNLYANYTYLNARVTDGSYLLAYQPGSRLIRRPRHTLGAGAVYSADRWQVGAEITGAYDRTDSGVFGGPAQQDLGGYTVARFFGNYQVNDNIEIYARLENAFDEEYDYVSGYEAPGAGAFIGARFLIGQ
ncbi:MAG: TonB-dependent receptor [Verrucomicrobiales bacterium]|nr:TonB-dependent receptor [Verrucomicrobiales bacterium]